MFMVARGCELPLSQNPAPYVFCFCASGRVHAASTQGVRVTGLSDAQSKRPQPASAACSLGLPPGSLRASEFVHSPETSWKERASRTEGLDQTCRAILHSRTGHRGLKSTTKERG